MPSLILVLLVLFIFFYETSVAPLPPATFALNISLALVPSIVLREFIFSAIGACQQTIRLALLPSSWPPSVFSDLHPLWLSIIDPSFVWVHIQHSYRSPFVASIHPSISKVHPCSSAFVVYSLPFLVVLSSVAVDVVTLEYSSISYRLWLETLKIKYYKFRNHFYMAA